MDLYRRSPAPQRARCGRHRLARGSHLLLIAAAVSGCVPVPDADRSPEDGPLDDTSWVLTALAGDSALLAPGERTLHLTFRGGGRRLTGFTGCNILTGSYSTTDSRLDFREPLAMTRRICPAPILSLQERAFLDALRRTNRYEISAERLNIYQNDSLLATFVPVGFAL